MVTRLVNARRKYKGLGLETKTAQLTLDHTGLLPELPHTLPLMARPFFEAVI